MKKFAIQGIILLLITLISVSCTKMEGAGEIIEKELSLSTFNSIQLSNDADVIIIPGETQRVTIRSYANLIDNLTTTVVDNKWIIDNQIPVNGELKMTICIEHPGCNEIKNFAAGCINVMGGYDLLGDLSLISTGSGDILMDVEPSICDNIVIDVSGSGCVRLHCDATESTRVECTGSGCVALEGFTHNLAVNLTNTGNFEGFSFISKNADVKTSGSGCAKVFAYNQFCGMSTKSGNIYVKGDPILLDKKLSRV